MRPAQALLLLMLAIVPLTATAAEVQVEGVRMWPAPDHTRLVLDLSEPVDHTLFSLEGPDRVVVDLKHARFPGSLPDFAFDEALIKKVRYAHRQDDQLRFVLDLKSEVKPKSFVLKPQGKYGHRLVIDLHQPQSEQAAPRVTKSVKDGKPREVIIAIDAGHGGEDPGAIGQRGTREKDVVMAVARKLEALVNKTSGMKPVMIRNGDYYLSLRERVETARRAQADLFISIHADAFHDRRAHGSSVYVVSDGGASSKAAQFLAESENSADLIGGVSLDDKEDLLKMVLVDMVQNSTIEDSHRVASEVLGGLGQINHLHKRQVEQAGFRVLKAPDMPSVLVETAFISNPAEERKLRSSAHQSKLAHSIFSGVKQYFARHAPAGTILAERKMQRHRINRGDTLSGIAARYRVSVSTIKQHNNLSDNMLRVGQVLQIPVI
ncbi:N-acetylmuramoyl-L-alanine amidase [Thiohalophilus thiocyanatoxydans]|uniref:N-acetylmuramoyl-L-alanine amidase AmiC n=1 Tax=Thiohalophilus thiocyanatoxydans TaxID=381308 RepID=A0A4R8IFI7_9GAMM|nr:N-acetylmuramoyl-L-alanine amidase [Thiohalophilus thiocyanatoxydans]TDX99280.1 N-acetylmuramoyl-L-alanine amidase [Thiohalophilus thiocyanatoxydans]